MPISIARYESAYNDSSYSGNIASATAIRNIIKNNGFDILRRLLPSASYSILIKNIKKLQIFLLLTMILALNFFQNSHRMIKGKISLYLHQV